LAAATASTAALKSRHGYAQGQSLTDATVSFSLSRANTQAQVMVTDGKYRNERHTGLKPGKYLIRVSKATARRSTSVISRPVQPTRTSFPRNLSPTTGTSTPAGATVTKDNPNTFGL